MTPDVIGALLVGVGLFAVVVSTQARKRRRVRNLRELVETAYLESGSGETAKETSKILARAGLLTERALGRSGAFARVTSRIERSDWEVTPGEFIAASVVAGMLGAGVGVVGSSTGLAVLLAAAGLTIPYLIMSRSVERRRAAFEDQFPDVLDLLAAALESGSSIQQSLEVVVSEASEPAASEFGRVLSAARLGAPLVDALKAMSERLGSRDLTWTVQAIVVQQRTGGRLADILRTVGEFMRAREEVRRELRALVAEGKLSAYILGALPFAVAGFLLLTNPDYLDPLFSTLPGLVMVVGASVMMVFGFFVMSRIIKIEV